MARKKTILDPIKCAICEKEFIPKTRRVRCCSKSCGGKLGNTKAAQEKGRQTKLEKYGDPNYNNREKAVETTKKIYGEEYTNASQVPHIKEKYMKTYIERHGGMGMASPTASKKTLETTKKKYGVENDDSIISNMQIPEVLNKMVETHEKRWGGIGYASEELAKRSMDTYKERYGEDLYDSPLRNAAIVKTWQENYGVNSPMLVPEIKEKALSNYIKNNGGMGNARDSVKVALEENINTFKELYDSEKYTIIEIENIMGISKDTAGRYAKELGIKLTQPNRLNESWKLLIKEETGIEFEYEGLIYGDNRRVDLYNDQYKIAIEINPTITHSTQPSLFHGKRVPVKYHQNRAVDAEANGWHLIQIFDWDKPEDIFKLLKALAGVNQTRIYARKCDLKEITVEDAREFLGENHRQQAKAIGNICYGLYCNDELVQVMTFSLERFARNKIEGSYELIRLASKEGHQVIGGASKLLKAFIKSEHHPNKIKTFVDYSKGQGKVYERMGMKYVGLANLNGLYANIDTGEAYKVTSVSQKFRKEYESLSMTQQEFMNSKRFYRINDAGNKIFEWLRE